MCEALKDEFWIAAMQEELNQFVRNEVWTFVPKTNQMNVIGTKWVFRNKTDDSGIITRNKARLVTKGYNQAEGIDYDETTCGKVGSGKIVISFCLYEWF